MPRGEYWFPEGCFIDEWSNTPDDPACSICRARVPAGGLTRWHWLAATAERYVVLSGRGRMELGAVGTPLPIVAATTREVGPGEVVVIPAGTPQRIAALGGEDLVFLAICTPRFTPECYQTESGAGPA
ncbi:MAG TPA: cupin domain-containing protein [Opitutaceae bacterium]|nr:cupin domain-containing protein [Opitutaceae bacterium]HOR25714.1 cupin domain-containing protein [Opitutaceae bacterium]